MKSVLKRPQGRKGAPRGGRSDCPGGCLRPGLLPSTLQLPSRFPHQPPTAGPQRVLVLEPVLLLWAWQGD